MAELIASSAAPSMGEEAIAVVKEHLQRIGFGSITLTIHDRKIVQLDVTEKRRLSR
jgi:hypothetical protein